LRQDTRVGTTGRATGSRSGVISGRSGRGSVEHGSRKESAMTVPTMARGPTQHLPWPVTADEEVLVRVEAVVVTSGDARIRVARFPPGCC
jgi:hypothetical protein